MVLDGPERFLKNNPERNLVGPIENDGIIIRLLHLLIFTEEYINCTNKCKIGRDIGCRSVQKCILLVYVIQLGGLKILNLSNVEGLCLQIDTFSPYFQDTKIINLFSRKFYLFTLVILQKPTSQCA